MSDVAPVMDIDDARRLTERIRLIAGGIADDVEKLRELVAKAKASDVHVVLGYASWTAYLRDVFGDEPLRLARDVRQELVAELAAQGMSTRAIAPIVGVSKDTVQRDIAGVSSETPAPASHGPVFTPQRTPEERTADATKLLESFGAEVDPTTGEVTIPSEPAEPRTVTGLDGKTYTSSPSAPRRTSIIDDARNAGWALRKAAERLERLREDDRFTKNKAEIMAALQPHLDFANEAIADL